LDTDALDRAAALAARAIGRTAPNPPVGAIVVRDGMVVGEGYHAAAGQPHAEVAALRAAGPAASGATLYVTLEPCCHYGRTPPCTDAILAAGVARVCYALADPDPRVAGEGHRRLVSAGITVEHLGRPAAQAVTRGFLTRLAIGRPWVTVKVATSVDGRIATRTGDSRWISGEASRAHVHTLRDRADAVVVGIGTVLADDPLLTVRPTPADGRQPLRLVLDSELRLPPGAALLADRAGPPPLVAFVPERLARHPDGDKRRTLLEARGAELLAVTGDTTGRTDVAEVMGALARRGLNEVLVEGGGEIVAACLTAGIVDELQACIAPVVIGGRQAPGPVGGEGVDRLAHAPRIRFDRVERIGDDVWLIAHPLHGAAAHGQEVR
jgi:diaminohydroxyphosphoribosylaminopyrimidine deaminase/5-amino-6-(5-phosphoribosylamino)uracil reductase